MARGGQCPIMKKVLSIRIPSFLRPGLSTPCVHAPRVVSPLSTSAPRALACPTKARRLSLNQRRYTSRLYRDLAREGTRCLCSSFCASVPLCLDSHLCPSWVLRSSGVSPIPHHRAGVATAPVREGWPCMPSEAGASAVGASGQRSRDQGAGRVNAKSCHNTPVPDVPCAHPEGCAQMGTEGNRLRVPCSGHTSLVPKHADDTAASVITAYRVPTRSVIVPAPVHTHTQHAVLWHSTRRARIRANAFDV